MIWEIILKTIMGYAVGILVCVMALTISFKSLGGFSFLVMAYKSWYSAVKKKAIKFIIPQLIGYTISILVKSDIFIFMIILTAGNGWMRIDYFKKVLMLEVIEGIEKERKRDDTYPQP